MDGHAGQMKNLEAIDLAKENALHHRLQPLDLTFFWSLKQAGQLPQGSYYMAAEQPGRAVTAYQVVHLLNESCLQAGHK